MQSSDRRIDDVASAIVLVERTVQPATPPNADFTARFTAPERNPFRRWRPPAEDIRVARIPDAILDGRFRGLFTASGFVRDTRYLTPESYFQSLHRGPDTLVRQTADDTPVIVGCNGAHANYFHWLTQALPAIDLALRRPHQAPHVRLALPPLLPWQQASLQLLGHAAVPRVEITDPDRQYAFRTIEHCNLLTGAAAFSLSQTVAQTYRRLREANPRPRLGRKIYVARSDTRHRAMRNEAAVSAGLAARGFEIWEAGRLGFADQIALFQEAAFVVGPHGAGLANIAFCHPGTFVYELVPQLYANSCFCALALLGGLSYWADGFESEGPQEVPPFRRAWESDTAAVLARVDEMAAMRTPTQAVAPGSLPLRVVRWASGLDDREAGGAGGSGGR